LEELSRPPSFFIVARREVLNVTMSPFSMTNSLPWIVESPTFRFESPLVLTDPAALVQIFAAASD
jgi:hypothetical protein